MTDTAENIKDKEVIRMTPEEAYAKIAELAREHALISAAAGGVVVVVHPNTQKAEGLYEHIQWVHGLGPHPETLKQQREAKA
jgi:cysteine synthase